MTTRIVHVIRCPNCGSTNLKHDRTHVSMSTQYEGTRKSRPKDVIINHGERKRIHREYWTGSNAPPDGIWVGFDCHGDGCNEIVQVLLSWEDGQAVVVMNGQDE